MRPSHPELWSYRELSMIPEFQQSNYIKREILGGALGSLQELD